MPFRGSYRRALGWALGWALGARQGRPRVPRLLGRWVALSPPVSRRPGSYPSPRPRRRPPPRRRPRPRRRRPQRGGKESPEPPPTPQTPRGVPTGSQHPLYKKIPRSGRKIFGRWVFNFGRWVFTDLGVGCLPRILGVGWHGPPVGRWMPLAKALGGVGGPREATARWEHKYRSLP